MSTTSDDREQQLIKAAFDLIEKRIYAGTATAEETTRFLRGGPDDEEL